jgi:hypothetical protein
MHKKPVVGLRTALDGQHSSNFVGFAARGNLEHPGARAVRIHHIGLFVPVNDEVTHPFGLTILNIPAT